jgi:DNA repair ATPase RecN
MTKSKTSSAKPKLTTNRRLRRSPPVATRKGRAPTGSRSKLPAVGSRRTDAGSGRTGQLTPAGPPPIDRIRWRNYQAIADADVPLGGLTVIVGANDSGKTALQRGLMALAFNQTGDRFIRYDQDAAEVQVEIDGLIVGWRKGESAEYYIDDGKEGRMPPRTFAKLGAAVPDPVADILGLRVIEIDATTKLTPQFRRHGDTPFLLDETATKAARVLAKNSRLDILVQSLAAQKKALRDLGKKLDTDAAQHARLEERLGEFPDLSVAEERAAEVQESMGRIEAAIAGIQAAQDYRLAKARVRTLQSLVEGLPDVAGLVDRLNALVPAYERLERALEAQEGALESQADADVEAAQAEADLREFAEGIDTCPVCGQPVESDMLLEHED